MTTSESKTELHRLMLEAAETGLSINDIEPIGTRLGIDPRKRSAKSPCVTPPDIN